MSAWHVPKWSTPDADGDGAVLNSAATLRGSVWIEADGLHYVGTDGRERRLGQAPPSCAGCGAPPVTRGEACDYCGRIRE